MKRRLSCSWWIFRVYGRFGVLVVDLHGCQHETIQPSTLWRGCHPSNLLPWRLFNKQLQPFPQQRDQKVYLFFRDVMYVLSSWKGSACPPLSLSSSTGSCSRSGSGSAGLLRSLDTSLLKWRCSSPAKGPVQQWDRWLALAIAIFTRQSAQYPCAPRSSRRWYGLSLASCRWKAIKFCASSFLVCKFRSWSEAYFIGKHDVHCALLNLKLIPINDLILHFRTECISQGN